MLDELADRPGGPSRWPRRAVIGVTLAALLLVIAVLGPHLTADPLALDIDHGLSAVGAPLPPSASAWLGTDPLGRDVLARVVTATGTSLWIASWATLISLVLGVLLGASAGLAGGRVDAALMRVVDLSLVFPVLLLAILLAALLRDADLTWQNAPVIVALTVFGLPTIARLVRAKARVVAHSEHVTAARGLGASPARVLVHHVLPNLAGVIAVAAAFCFAFCLLGEATLSYLGLGPPPPAPTWGRMIYEGRAYYRSAPWLVLAPGVAIVVAVLAFNLLADGLRAIVEPPERR